MTGFRIKLARNNHVPQLGAALEGSLRFRGPDGSWRQLPLRPVALGDFDNCRRWVEIGLAAPVNLPETTEATLFLDGKPPHPFFSFVRFSYVFGHQQGHDRYEGAVLDGTQATGLNLCLAAGYRPSR